MHMSDALLSPAVGIGMCVVSAGSIAYAASKTKKDGLDGGYKPAVMGVMGAFVFAAQMINIAIPFTGSSGHIGGGILLAAMLGEASAFLTISAVLIIQALFFADGGLLALGCNIFNMGFVTCFLAYPLLFRPIVKGKVSAARITLASMLSSVFALQAGAFLVVLETLASGITELPFDKFLAFMQPIHLAVGVLEGIITAAVLVFVYKARPELTDFSASEKPRKGLSRRTVLVSMLTAAVLVSGLLSLIASSDPDGLEWSILNVAGTSELDAHSPAHEAAALVQESIAFMPDYGFKSESENGSAAGTSVSGLIGGALTFAIAAGSGFIISAAKRAGKRRAERGEQGA